MPVSPEHFIATQPRKHHSQTGLPCSSRYEISVDAVVGRLIHGGKDRRQLALEIIFGDQDFLMPGLEAVRDFLRRAPFAELLFVENYSERHERRRSRAPCQRHQSGRIHAAA